MSEYWNGLLKHKEAKKMVEYDTPMHGQQNIAEVREQIQEDILTYVDVAFGNKKEFTDGLCQIVVNNFKKLEK
jgi:hypothetical protein